MSLDAVPLTYLLCRRDAVAHAPATFIAAIAALLDAQRCFYLRVSARTRVEMMRAHTRSRHVNVESYTALSNTLCALRAEREESSRGGHDARRMRRHEAASKTRPFRRPERR